MYRMRIEELVSTEQQLVMHCADVKSQLTLLLEAKGISALETRVIKQLSFQASVLSVVQVTAGCFHALRTGTCSCSNRHTTGRRGYCAPSPTSPSQLCSC
jgi:hypothetical protein